MTQTATDPHRVLVGVMLVLLLAVRLAWRRTPARPIAKA
jgi:hypothetical protein